VTGLGFLWKGYLLGLNLLPALLNAALTGDLNTDFVNVYNTAFKNIWLADDDVDDQEIFIEVIEQILPSVPVSIFSNGDALLAAFEAGKKPDILFLDINMPCRDGLDCLKQIRLNTNNEKLPVIIFSSSVQPKHINDSYTLGASLYYKKPSSFNELIQGLSNLLCMDWKDPYTITKAHYINHQFIPYSFQ
jgi:CheY-like chemotaxis protein